ncbi:porin [Paraburkholderia heleia]|uniref:porin n=1 Tax=Paraburkholderia heleia TaxID=634127 RepID=UPI0031D27DBA
MKRQIFVCVACVASIGLVHAQSSVTLYGQVDGNVAYVNNAQSAATSKSGRPVGGSIISLLDNGASSLSSSRWGLKGIEDLGSGVKAIFNLENGFNMNNGTFQNGGALFGRLAFVGLSSDLGTLKLGRQGDTSVDYVSPLTYGWEGGNLAIHPADYDDLVFSRHLNNTVKYNSPTYAGFQYGALYSFGGVAGNFTQNQVWSVGARYSGGVVSLAVSYVNARNPNFSFYGTNPSSSATGLNMGSPGSATSPESNASIAGFAGARTQQTITSAATLSLGGAILGLAYSHAEFSNLDSNPSLNTFHYTGSTGMSSYEGSARYYITPVLIVGGSYTYTYGGDVANKGSATYQQMNCSLMYLLSKTTSVFLSAAYQHASGTDSFGRPAVAAIGYLTASTTNKQVAASLGLKHSF